MSSNHHTPIPSDNEQEATSALFNSRFSELDAAIGDLDLVGVSGGSRSSVQAVLGASLLRTPVTSRIIPAINSVYDLIVAARAEIDAATTPYASLDERLDAIDGGYVGGNIASLTNGPAAAGQKDVSVDDTTGFLVGGRVAYQLVGGALEYNVIASITPTTVLTMTTNIGTGGIGDNVYIGLISINEYLAAQAIPHAGELTLPQEITAINRGVFLADAYGASPSASASDNVTAIQAAIDAANATNPKSTVELGSGEYSIDGPIALGSVRMTGVAGTPQIGTIIKATHSSATISFGSGGCLSDICFNGDDLATIGVTLNDSSEVQLRNVYILNCATGIKITETSSGSGIASFDGLVVSACTTAVEMACAVSSSFWFRGCNFWDSTTVFDFTGANGSSLIVRDSWFEKFDSAFNLSTGTTGRGFDHIVIDANHFISTNGGVSHTCRIFKSTLTADVGIIFNDIVFSGNYLFLTNAAYIVEIDWGSYIGSGANRFGAEFRDNYFAWSPLSGTNLVAWLKSDCAQTELVKIGWHNNTDTGRSLLVQDGAQPMNRRAQFAALDATPSVASRDEIYYTYNYAGATTITGFDDGFAGQRIVVLFPDSNTTVDFSGTSLKGNAGADWTASAGDWLEAVFDGTNWYCAVHETV